MTSADEPPPARPRVFVSYSKPDESVAQDVVDALESCGLSAWFMKRDVPGGSNYALEIDRAISEAQVFVLVYSGNTVDSKGCDREVGLADEQGLPIVPIRLDDTPLSGQFTYRLGNLHSLDWRRPDFLDQLVAGLQGHLGPGASSLRPAAATGLRRPPAIAERITLTGRDEECALIGETIRAVAETGHGRLLLIEGASGVGKSMLTRHAVAAARSSGFEVAATVCEPFHEGMSFFPIRELMRQITTSGSPTRDVAAMYGGGSVEASMAHLVDAEGIDALARRDALLATFANLVVGTARGRAGSGLVLVVDDMERADPGTVDSLLVLLARLREAPVVVLGTLRSDDPTVRTTNHNVTPLLRAAARAPELAATLSLGPIGKADMLNLATAILGGPARLPSSFVEHLWRETEGNPLFCREILRVLQDQRSAGGATLRQHDGVWHLQGDLVGWQTPPSVEDAIRSRLELIEPDHRAELERASVIGKRFAFELMARIAEIEESRLLSLLEDCVNLALIQEAAGHDDAFEFTHGKIRDVLYESMTRIRRRRLHSIVADALAGMKDVVSGQWEAFIGEHLFRAARYEEAAPYLVTAARDLMDLSASTEAARLLDQALVAHRQAQAGDDAITPVRLAHVEALVASNDYRRALELAVEASSDAGVDRVTQGWFIDIIGDIHRANGRRDEAVVAYRRAEEIAIAESSPRLELEVCADMAELFERAAEQTAGFDDVEELRLRSLGDEYLERQVALAEAVGNGAARARALRNTAKRLRRNGEIEASLAAYEEGVRLSDPRVATHTLLISYAKTLRFADRIDEAVEVVNRVLAWSSQAGARRSLGIALHYRAMLTMEAFGRAAPEARRDLLDAREIHREISYERGRWEVATLLGEWHAMDGDRAGAITYFREAVPDRWPADADEGVELIARQLDGIAERARAERLRSVWRAS